MADRPNGATQDDVAAAVGLHPRGIGAIERGAIEKLRQRAPWLLAHMTGEETAA